jgi:hypothetical protein
MSEIITVGLDLAKNIFQSHGADALGHAVLRKKLRRDQALEFSGGCRPASLPWKLVVARISGAARSANWP